jgi:hypothetical protein
MGQGCTAYYTLENATARLWHNQVVVSGFRLWLLVAVACSLVILITLLAVNGK